MNAKSKIILFFTIALILLLGGFYLFNNYHDKNCIDCEEQKNFSDILNQFEKDQKNQEEVTKQGAKEKIESIRKKLALKGLIIKGDIYLKNKEYTSALVKFLKIHKEIPNDLETIHKIGDTYFELKKFSQAYKYYKQTLAYQHLNKERYVLSLLYSKNIELSDIENIYLEIDSLNLSKQETFYYKNSLSCIVDFSLCKKDFQDFFQAYNNQSPQEETSSGTTQELIPYLTNIENAIKNYENFQIDDLSYKNALISGAFFTNGLYPVAIFTAKDNLKDKPDYRPMLKVVAVSYYEMGYFIEAKDYLVKYNELGDKEADISYFLGVVYEKLNEFILSSIHFKKALILSHPDTTDINRRLVYNYYRLDQMDKILSTFQNQIEHNFDTLKAEDLNLAIFYHILNDKFEEAKGFTQRSIEKYPENETFYGYNAWIFIEEYKSEQELQNNGAEAVGTETETSETKEKISKLKLAEKNIQKALELNEKNPMINLIKGKIEIENGEYKKAFIYFKKTIGLDKGGEFEQIAKQELERLEELKK